MNSADGVTPSSVWLISYHAIASLDLAHDLRSILSHALESAILLIDLSLGHAAIAWDTWHGGGLSTIHCVS